MKASDFFSLPPSLEQFAKYFSAEAPPWDWIKQIAAALGSFSFEDSKAGYPLGVHVEGPVYLHPSVKLTAHATILGPTWIGANTEIRPGAFIRGNVIVGEGCVLGNSSEFKNCLIMDRAQIPHFNYVGDSILGNGAHLSAGAICSNLRLDKNEIMVRTDDQAYPTGLKKFGAILGDYAEVGCNGVLNPGSVLGRRALVMPTVSFAGYLPANMIAKVRQTVVTQPRRD